MSASGLVLPGTIKYWNGTDWVLSDGTITTVPGISDVAILGADTLAQSGTVPLSGLGSTQLGILAVGGSGPWTLTGTGGTGSGIGDLIVDTGADVTIRNSLNVKNIAILDVFGKSGPATISLNDGLPPGATIDFPGAGAITYVAKFSGTNTIIDVSSTDKVIGEISVAGKVKFLGQPIDDGLGGSKIVVDSTRPVIVDPYLILDVRGVNDIGRASGERITIGDANVTPDAYQGTTVSATAATGAQINVPFAGSAAIPNQFGTGLAYDPSNPADAYEIKPWTLTAHNGTAVAKVKTPSLVGVTPVPYATNVIMSGSSANPTFSWLYPAGSVDGVFFDIFDSTNKTTAASADLVYSATIPGNTGTFTVPDALAGGLTLQQGHHYTLDLYGVVARHRTLPLNNANSKSWSETYFDFVPAAGTATAAYLPTVSPAGVYSFNVSVAAGQVYYFDPVVATGFTYATGAGNPNFASVVLPAIQTSAYQVSFGNNGTQETDTVAPSTVFAFPNGGVDTFTVTGIDPANNLDPVNPTGFVTGLTFGSSGTFSGTQTPIVSTALCFCTGTWIATPSGEVLVERLAVGDKVLTRQGGVRPITWIGVGNVLATRGRRNAATPVVIRRGALAENVPNRDLRVTKGHALLLDDVLIPVEFLVNHRSIHWDDRAQEVALYHIETDRHDILLANGAPAESYRDDGNRWLFQNANSGRSLPSLQPCAPILTGGSVVDAVWHRLLLRSGPRPGVAMTDDPDLNLLVDGRWLQAASCCDQVHIFSVPDRPAAARIVSRAAIPAELGLARDPRSLGVAVGRIAIRQGTRFRIMEAGDPALTSGFYAFEPQGRLRWTDGDAALPPSLFDSFEGPMELVLHLSGTTRYPLLAGLSRSA